MTTIEDAKLLGWERVVGHWYSGGTRVVEVYRDGDHTTWWSRVSESAGRYASTEDAALEAAIDATPLARRLLAALREVEALRAELSQAARDEVVAEGEIARLRAEAEALRALVPEVEAEWRRTLFGWSRPWIGVYDESGTSIPALLVEEAETLIEWSVGDVTGIAIAEGTAPDLATAQRECEDAARRLGVLRG